MLSINFVVIMSSSSDSEKEHRRAQREKMKPKKKFVHRYQSSWETEDLFKLWIGPSKKGTTHFFCKYCANDYVCGKAELLKHIKTKKHETNMKQSKFRQTLTSMVPKISAPLKKARENEIRIASFIVEHNIPFNVSGHLVQLIKHLHLEKEILEKTSCARTKCTSIVNKVTGTYFMNNLLKLLRNHTFSLIIDESTDVGTVKHLALVVRIFNDSAVEDKFLAIIEVADGTAQNIYQNIVDFFIKNNVDYKNRLVGFAADGASTMMGRHNSVSKLLQNDIPHLFILKCVCHSFALVASYASREIPDEVENLCKHIYNYFKSFKRLTEYREFQNFVDIKPHKILHPCQVRWLSMVEVVNRLLEQYNALQLYFRQEYFENKTNQVLTIIHSSLENVITKLYLEFLKYVLCLFTDINKEFQSEHPKIYVLYAKIKQVYITLLENYIDPNYLANISIEQAQFRNPEHFLNIDSIYLGPYVAATLGNSDINFPKHEADRFKKRCLAFYIEAANQIYQRFPFQGNTAEILKQMDIINPLNVKSRKHNSIVPLAVHFKYILGEDLMAIDVEWRLLRNESLMLTMDTTDVVEFWQKIKTILNPDGTEKYRQVITLVELILCLPHSSATCERLFSAINLNKTKLRNKLSTESLTGILHTKDGIGSDNCFDYSIPEELISKFQNLNTSKE